MRGVLVLVALLLALCSEGREYFNFSDACSLSIRMERGVLPFQSCSKRGSHSRLFSKNFTFSSAFSSLLSHRTIVFIGDSTMGMQHYAFCTSLGQNVSDETLNEEYASVYQKSSVDKMVDSSHDDLSEGESYPDVVHTVNPGINLSDTSLKKICRHEQRNVTAIFLGYGRLYQWEKTLTGDHMRLIEDTINDLHGPRDVVLFSVGVHWHYFCDKPLSHKDLASMNNFEHALLQLLALVSGKGKYTGLKSSGPFLIYREALPQHFPSSNGHFPSPHIKSSSHSCIDLNENTFSGLGSPLVQILKQHYTNDKLLSKQKISKRDILKTKTNSFVHNISALIPSCNPNCLPSSWQNNLAQSIIKSDYEYIHILHVFHKLECFSREHNKRNRKDCTHYTPRANIFLNALFFTYLEYIDKSDW